jgi:hypothetical protein
MFYFLCEHGVRRPQVLFFCGEDISVSDFKEHLYNKCQGRDNDYEDFQ